MDKFVTRSKKNPTPTSASTSSEELPKEAKKEKKAPKKESKVEKKAPKKEPTEKKARKKTPPKGEDSKDTKMKKALNSEVKDANDEGSQLAALLPSIQTTNGQAISDEDLEKLFFAICGDTGKYYDSDDSIISDIDHMDDEEIAEKDRNFREVIDSIKKNPETLKRIRAIRKINTSKETPAEREERRRIAREMMDDGTKTKEEKEKAQRCWEKKMKRLENRLKTVVQVFDKDQEKVSQLRGYCPPLMTCRQFSLILEAMAEVVPEKDEMTPEGLVDYRTTIKNIDSNKLEAEIKLIGDKMNFFCEGKSISEYLKKKLRKLFLEDQIIDVVDGVRYGFVFTTKDCILALENYYSANIPSQGDNGSTATPLAIKTRQFVKSCYSVARGKQKDLVLNEALKYALFG